MELYCCVTVTVLVGWISVVVDEWTKEELHRCTQYLSESVQPLYEAAKPLHKVLLELRNTCQQIRPLLYQIGQLLYQTGPLLYRRLKQSAKGVSDIVDSGVGSRAGALDWRALDWRAVPQAVVHLLEALLLLGDSLTCVLRVAFFLSLAATHLLRAGVCLVGDSLRFIQKGALHLCSAEWRKERGREGDRFRKKGDWKSSNMSDPFTKSTLVNSPLKRQSQAVEQNS
ncbi:uncharacterized protein LOC136771834 [Amia ocellicauda]|uniref:uncharacterized protein LOC136771834 n=1 Tax=Amia ocellicauda TaxID=2972642 RepID=UPI00346460E6